VTELPRDPLGEMLKRLRKARQLTQEALAQVSDVPVRTISDLERGVTLTPHMSTVRRLADALGLAGEERSGFEAAAQQNAPTPAAAIRKTVTAGESTEAVPGGSASMRMLPRDIDSFTGREAELRYLMDAGAAAASASGPVRICVIEGMAGVGKTSLALRAAHPLAGQFPDGQLFLDLQGHTLGLKPLSAEAALRALLRALGVRSERIPRKPEECAAFYRSCLAGTKTLIILDNASSAAQVRHLLPGTAGCLVIVTSRRNLNGLDDARIIPLDTPPETEAITLFRTVAGHERVRADDPALGEIIGLCGCLPLAVRIIAARMSRRRALLIDDVLEELRDEHGRLADLQDEDRSITAVFGTSYRRLPEPERLMFQRLGLIPGPVFDAYAAAALTGTDLSTARRHLESLLDHNLLIQRSSGRYRFHDLIRVYARTLTSRAAGRRVPASGVNPSDSGDTVGDTTRALSRLLDFYLYSAQMADRQIERRIPPNGKPRAVPVPHTVPRLDTPGRAQAWLSAELANLDAATRYAASHQGAAHAVGLSAALAHYLRAHGPWTQAVSLHRLAVTAAAASGDIPGRAEALAFLGVTERLSGALTEAEGTLTQAVELYRQLRDRRGEAGTLVELGITQRLTQEPRQAAATITRALEFYRALGDDHGQAAAFMELGAVQRQMGTFESAGESLSSALERYRVLGNRVGEGASLAYLGSVQYVTGALTSARESIAASLQIYRELGDPIGQANCLLFLGGIDRDAGALKLAADSLAGALEIYTDLGDRRMQAGALAYLGVVQRLRGDHERAEKSFAMALQRFREVHDRGGEAETLNYYAALALATGAPAEARTRHGQALHLAQKISSSKDEADALNGIGAAYRSEGQIDNAVTYFRQALALYESQGCETDAARVQAALDDLEKT